MPSRADHLEALHYAFNTELSKLTVEQMQELTMEPYESLLEPCARCGEPARGYAAINNLRYCHPDEGESCYELTQFDPTEILRLTEEAMGDTWRCGDCGHEYPYSVTSCPRKLDNYLSVRGGSIESSIKQAVDEAIAPLVEEALRKLEPPKTTFKYEVLMTVLVPA